jgi:RNA polymerase sigma-70 factor (ECF subfamily)
MTDLAAFYDLYVDKVYKYFYVQCLNRHVAEDLTSQTFLSFVGKKQNTDIEDDKKYLYAIMRNVWAEYLRKRYTEAVESVEHIEDFEAHTEASVMEFEALSMKERALIYIERLPDKQREVARMRLLEELSVGEVAQQLHRSSLYVKTTQHRALKSLKQMLKAPEIGSILS